jgi:hypothetical protein
MLLEITFLSEESVTNSGETKFNSNLPIMLNAFAAGDHYEE